MKINQLKQMSPTRDIFKLQGKTENVFHQDQNPTLKAKGRIYQVTSQSTLYFTSTKKN